MYKAKLFTPRSGVKGHILLGQAIYDIYPEERGK